MLATITTTKSEPWSEPSASDRCLLLICLLQFLILLSVLGGIPSSPLQGNSLIGIIVMVPKSRSTFAQIFFVFPLAMK